MPPSNVIDTQTPQAAFQLRQLSLLRDGGSVLLHVDEAVFPANQFVCITGPSGAGKSSLLFALAGLNQNFAGTIRFQGCRLDALSTAQLAGLRRSSMGIVFQHFQLFDELSAFDNAAMQAMWGARLSRDTIRQHVTELLSRLRIEDIQIACAKLSGGERQRVAVARALASRADVMLADEPTACLDRQTAKELTALLLDNTVGVGGTLIACTHDQDMLERADVVWTLSDGLLHKLR